MKKLFAHLLMLSLLVLPLVACQPAANDEGEADEAMETAGEAMDEAADEMSDATEEAGEAMDEAMDEASDAADEAMDKAEEATEDAADQMAGDDGQGEDH